MEKAKTFLEKRIKKLEEEANSICEPYGFKAFVIDGSKFNVTADRKIDLIRPPNKGGGFIIMLDGPSLMSKSTLSAKDYRTAIKLAREIQGKYKEISKVWVTGAVKK